MRRRIIITVALALFLMGVASLPWAAGQETAKQADVDKMETDLYKVVLTVNEMEDGKKINSRNYSLRLRPNLPPTGTRSESIRIGSRVPYAVEAGKFEYIDVGMNLDCRIFPIPNGNVVIYANWEYSSVEGGRMVSQNTQNPVIRRVRSNVEAIVPLDKPTVLTEMDDVTSTRSYVFEAKVTKISP